MTLVFRFHELLSAADQQLELQGHVPIQRALRHDLRDVEPLAVTAKVQYVDRTAHVVGEASTAVEYSCGRCLKNFHDHVQLDIDELFVRQAQEDADQLLVESEDEVHVVDQDDVDFAPYAEQLFWLSLPLVPLCKKDCQGLCPSCGVDRNESSCSCDVRKVDPRWADLENFFSKH